jgi:hypothetical protein
MNCYSCGKYRVDEIGQDYIDHVSKHMRQGDIDEIHKSHGMTPHEALMHSWETSDQTYALIVDDVPFAIFGIAMTGDNASIWMLATPEIEMHKRFFHKISKIYLEHFQKKAKVLYNFVSIDNKISIQWLSKLGAMFSEPMQYGKYGKQFLYFELKGN